MPLNEAWRIGFAPAMTKLSWSAAQWNEQGTSLPDRIDLASPRNAVAAVQIRLLARKDFVLLLDRSNWLHPLGFCPRMRLEISFPGLPAAAVEAFPVGYVEGDDRRAFMEYLDRSGYVEVPAYRPQAVYLRIRIPAGVPAGLYEGRVRAYEQQGFEDESLAWQGTVGLTVAEAALPDVRERSFHLNLWQHCTSVARHHRVGLWSDAHFALLDRYYASLAELGQKTVSVIAAELPWSGQRCFRERAYPSYLFEHAIVEVARGGDGRLRFDYAKLDRLLALAATHGMDREIEVFGLINVWRDDEFGFGAIAPDAPDAVRIRCYDEQSGAVTYLRSAEDLSQFVRALQDHFEQRGLLDRVRIAADEPANLEAFRASLAFLKAAAPGFRYKAYINHFEFMEDAPVEVIDAVPVLPLACRDLQLTADFSARLHGRGGRLLWYVCCWPPFPNTFLHSPLVEGELHGWLTFRLGLDGFERWAFCLWPADPWQRVSWRAPDWPAGDMYFVLPGPDGAPVETLRYEALRTATQDYELLNLARRNLPDEQAQALTERAFARILHDGSVGGFAMIGAAEGAPRAENLYSLDPADYEAARQVLLEGLRDDT